MKFATSLGMENNVTLVSLGKGQGPRAEEMIKVNDLRHPTIFDQELN